MAKYLNRNNKILVVGVTKFTGGRMPGYLSKCSCALYSGYRA